MLKETSKPYFEMLETLTRFMKSERKAAKKIAMSASMRLSTFIMLTVAAPLFFFFRADGGAVCF